MFLTQTSPLSIFVFFCFSYVGQLSDIFGAIANGDVEMVGRLLLSGVSINVRANVIYNNTPLHLAARYNRTEIAQLLITHKADIEARNEYNNTPLHLAARYNSTEIAQLLITHKADIEARDEDNNTPLHLAAENNSTEIAQLLIAHKADIEARDEDNNTPLDLARKSTKNTEIVIRLLTKHAANTSLI